MKILNTREVLELTGFCRRTLYTAMDQGRFPRPIQLTARRVGWVEDELKGWLARRMAERDKGAAA